MDDFGGGLARDPAIALPSRVPVPPEKPGPLHRVEFAVEFVGPYGVSAATASKLLDADWYLALGSPRLWAMLPQDERWQPLVARVQGAYDSVALSWPVVTERGTLSGAAAYRLLEAAAGFGPLIHRRPIPLPPPDTVDGTAAELAALRRKLDLVPSFRFEPARPGGVPETEIWRLATAFGLTFDNGAFVWRTDHPRPLLRLASASSFSLGAVRAGATHASVALEFRLPVSPNPARSIEAALRVGRALCDRFGGRLVSPEGDYVDAGVARRWIHRVTDVDGELRAAKILPGSAEAALLFGGP